ncbi:hypothetical protein AMAG_03185 [Allomyces macrogynus ATCC 38327]|uniref:DUF155 domain-containing protein n=1 Tax=Allomyces macrogynus (strain ATCC 38327) TaxID=578462 RepID=A0A0L0S540_ALLM3|nr:hypothetical protein AMAG_03185 [Allomyces macrogynus ATCC 38327]|eukprot:KNE57474.1 hypothetical protein AMAG_03185 [Allomyces macrogynus ATCC 38327]
MSSGRQNSQAMRRKSRQAYHRLPTDDGPMAGSFPTRAVVPAGAPTLGPPKPHKQPNRTTKTAQKLTLFPEDAPVTQPSQLPEELLLPEAEDLYDQLTQVPPERIGKLDRKKLPRVTAYCTANSYRLDDLISFLKARPNVTPPKKFDECLYVALYSSVGQAIPQPMHSHTHPGLDVLEAFRAHSEALTALQHNVGELFCFEYGVLVFWGFNEDEEKSIIRELAAFEDESLGSDVETEEFVFHYNSNYQPRIYNDIISLKNPANYMAKLTISHAIAQSTKLTLFEGLIEETISATKHIPQTMATSGKVPMSRTAITKKIGQLFIMRINVNLVSNVLDTPEIFWSEPALEPLYQAIRGYLEISQRVELLNQRVSVISDLLDMLKEHLTSTHGEQLEWIVIVLIGFEILIGLVTILFDYVAWAQGRD